MPTFSPEDIVAARSMTPPMVKVLRLARDRRERPDMDDVELWDAFIACQDAYAVEDTAGGSARITARGIRLLRAYGSVRSPLTETETEKE